MRFRSATLAATLVAATVTPLALSLSAGPAAAAPAKYADDFNGDGHRDTAVFSYGTETRFSKGGGVLVTFGTADGPGTKTQFIDQASAGVPGADETDDFFGEIRTAADFDKDGYGDLAVSANGENVGTYKDKGTVTVLWGGPKGLSGGTTVPFKGPKGVSGEARDFATGDFDGDGSPDLALVRDSKTYVYRGAFTRSGVKGAVTVLDKDTSSFYSTAVVSGKIDKDGKTDLVVIGDVVTPGVHRLRRLVHQGRQHEALPGQDPPPGARERQRRPGRTRRRRRHRRLRQGRVRRHRHRHTGLRPVQGPRDGLVRLRLRPVGVGPLHPGHVRHRRHPGVVRRLRRLGHRR